MCKTFVHQTVPSVLYAAQLHELPVVLDDIRKIKTIRYCHEDLSITVMSLVFCRVFVHLIASNFTLNVQ